LRSFGLIRPLSLTHRLLALTLVACIPGLLALAYNAYDLRKTRYDEVHAEAMQNTKFAVAELDQIFDGVKNMLHAASQAAELRQSDNALCSDYIRRVRKGIDALASILVVNPDGSVRCSSEPQSVSINLLDRAYFHEVLASKKFSVGTFTLSRISNQKMLPLQFPLLNGGNVEGVMMAGLKLDWLSAQINERGLASGNAVVLAGRDGIIVSREPEPEKYIGTPVNSATMALLNSSKAGSVEIESVDGTTRIAGYVPVKLTSFGLFVSSGISKDEALRAVDKATARSLLLFALGSLVALVLTWLVGEGIIRRPLMKILATAQAWRHGHNMVRTGIVDRDDEIGLLGQTFDSLMDENQQREAERKTAEARREILVHELAHRVKNTLATVQSIASLSFRDNQGPEALRGFQDRLQALVRSHDLLTRRNWERADILEIADVALAPLRGEKSHRFTLSGPLADLPPTTAVPVAMILSELCTNAMKYGALSNDRGHVAINWTTAPHEHGTIINLTWREQGGPPVQSPEREGFGTRLIANLAKQMHGGFEISYPLAGVICHIRLLAPKTAPRDESDFRPVAPQPISRQTAAE
jgi:two-component sensor histidine kinase